MLPSTRYAYELYCEERYKLPTPADVDQLEETLEAALPDDFREYLLEFNGGRFARPAVICEEYDDLPNGGIDFMYGIGAPLDFADIASDFNINFFEDNVPRRIALIGETEGNFLILLVVDEQRDEYGSILFRTFDQEFLVADGIDEFFGLLGLQAGRTSCD